MPAQAIQKQKLLYIFLASILLTIGYAAAQSQQGHPWTEITLPSSPNVWTGLNADMLDGLHYADFSARLWSGYDPSTDNIWYNDGGNVGIGTTAPSQKLDVSGNIRASGSLTGSQICIGTDCINSWSDVRDTDWTESGGNVYRTSGNVGIGTATPQAKLEVKDGFIYNTKTDATIARIGLKNSIREWAISAYGNDFAPNGGLVISDETTPRAVMIFNTNGNVGIGTTNPGATLDVNGKIRGEPDCRIVSAIGVGGAVAQCKADEFVLTGGGACETQNLNCGICACSDLGFLHLSVPQGNGWTADCYKWDGTSDVCVKAFAVCCKKGSN